MPPTARHQLARRLLEQLPAQCHVVDRAVIQRSGAGRPIRQSPAIPNRRVFGSAVQRADLEAFLRLREFARSGRHKLPIHIEAVSGNRMQ